MKPPFQARVLEEIRLRELIPAGQRVLAAVSGGVDSMVLARSLLDLGFHVEMAHVHHGLRGADADADAELVRRSASEWGAAFHFLTIAADLAATRQSSLQADARDLRYRALAGRARELGIGIVAVGHHRDDQAETVLQQIIRGAGLSGLAGMRWQRPLEGAPPISLIRPLLGETRDEIARFAAQAEIAWREDGSNADPAYQRSSMRAFVLPAIRHALGSDPSGPIARTASLVRAYADAEVDPVAEAILVAAKRPVWGRGGLLLAEVLDPLPTVWRQRLYLGALERWLPEARRDGESLARIDALRDSQTGRLWETAGGCVWRERDGLAFVRAAPAEAERSLADAEVSSGGWTIRKYSSMALLPQRQEGFWAFLDADPGAGAWNVRAWRHGDRLAAQGTVEGTRVKEILTPDRVPSYARAQHPVVTLGGEIVWVVGIRAASRYAAGSLQVARTVLFARRSGEGGE